MIANVIPAPAAAPILVDCQQLEAANTPCYATQALRAYRVRLQQPRTRIRDTMEVLARGVREALERAESARPGFLISGWEPV
ncbi:Uncharacterized protein ChrSV_2343 [Chromobacterium vaccinii]|nr:Uncharacterized protein ChrSW_2343 [Chromobacterium vaccinii]QND89800.1 Uncharacterized protein ChrSV_2343 [Chromobacterium vaccinii]